MKMIFALAAASLAVLAVPVAANGIRPANVPQGSVSVPAAERAALTAYNACLSGQFTPSLGRDSELAMTSFRTSFGNAERAVTARNYPVYQRYQREALIHGPAVGTSCTYSAPR